MFYTNCISTFYWQLNQVTWYDYTEFKYCSEVTDPTMDRYEDIPYLCYCNETYWVRWMMLTLCLFLNTVVGADAESTWEADRARSKIPDAPSRPSMRISSFPAGYPSWYQNWEFLYQSKHGTETRWLRPGNQIKNWGKENKVRNIQMFFFFTLT